MRTIFFRTRRKPAVLSAFVTLLVASVASSAHAADLAQCRAVVDNQARLACYDDVADRPAAAAVKPAEGAGRGPAVSPSGGATDALGARSAATAAAQPRSPSETFGLERKSTSEVDELRSSIPGVFNGWEPKTQFRLANGQVWQVSDGSRAVYRLNDPAVVITRGALGNFFMEFGGLSHAVSVRRIK